jgi:hypothetical protein
MFSVLIYFSIVYLRNDTAMYKDMLSGIFLLLHYRVLRRCYGVAIGKMLLVSPVVYVGSLDGMVPNSTSMSGLGCSSCMHGLRHVK